MGLLTDPSDRGHLTPLFLKHGNKLCFISYVVGIVWFGLLAWEPCNNRTYFSENALLPGLVQREFALESVIGQLHESLKAEAQSHSSIPYAWLQAQFRQLALDVYFHNYTLHYPFGSKSNFTGKNFYAILRAPRAASTEALVLSSPYRAMDSPHDPTLPGIALMISLAKYFKRYSYWAKDIIFLVTEHEQVGFQAWLDAYHGTCSPTSVLDCGQLDGRSGSIQAAINLEIHADRLTHVDLKVIGQNGQLPNLDLFNLVVELCTRESVHSTLHMLASPYEGETWQGWQQSLHTMLSMVAVQATGLPTGGHGLFHKFAIQALTLEGHAEGVGVTKVPLVQVGRVLEGVFRSLNNLLERFHQSFFFYLLPSTRRYVSIGLYMPPFCFIAASLLIKALCLYLSLEKLTEEELDTKVENIDTGFKKKHVTSLWIALPSILSSHLLGCLILLSPEWLDKMAQHMQWPIEDAMYGGMLALQIVAVTLMTTCGPNRDNESLQAYRCIALLEVAAFIYTLSLINISTAVVLSVVFVPVMVTAGTGRHIILRYLHRLCLLLIHPMMLTFFILVAQSAVHDWTFDIAHHLGQAFRGHKKVVLFSVEDWYIYGNWGFPGVTAFVLPAWLQMIAL